MASTRLVAVIIVALGTFAPGCASTSAPIHAAAPQTNVCTAKLVEGGNLNGKTIDAAHDAITVAPGAPIKGSIAVETFNAMHENAVAPLGGTVDWGNRCEQPWLAERWIETGTHRYVVQVDKTAPNKPGTYHIIVAFRGEYNVGQVMSLTNWSAYDD